MVPAIMYGLARAGRLVLRRRLGVEGLLAHANLTSAIPRLSISVAALAVSLSMMVAIAVMIGSFRDTVVYWVGQTLKADLFIGPGIRPTVGSEQTVSEDVIATLATHPAVDALDRFRNVDLLFEGNLAVLGAGSYDVVLEHGGLLFKSPANARDEVLRAIGQDTVIVSEAVRHAVSQTRRRPHQHPDAKGRAALPHRGDLLRLLERPWRRRSWIAAPSGNISASCRRPASRPTSRPGADPEKVRGEMLGMIDEGHRAFIFSNQHAARRDSAGLRQHLCDHLRARARSRSSSPCSAWPARC